jgi:hypothetical protein
MKSHSLPAAIRPLSAGILISISACVAYVPPPGPIAYGPSPVVQGAPVAPGPQAPVVAGTPPPAWYPQPYYYPPPYAYGPGYSAPGYYGPGYYGSGYYGPGLVLGFGGWHGGGRR